MSSTRYKDFVKEIERARDLVGLGQSLSSLTQGRVGGEDLYRSALVHCVAALDSYIHGVVLDRAVDILMMRSSAGSGGKVGLPFVAIGQIFTAARSGEASMEIVARSIIAERLALETYQRPDDIGSALAMVGISKIWSIAFAGEAGQRKIDLGLVVSRRNRIVHQCDLDPLNPGSITPLSDIDALASITTIEEIVTGIDKAV
ncbi:hypothetical protein [Nonomuraea harbinensis]|uniref:RiboL-PSP-HEPN domain-containing protein n=1 Tax=Nonomuraea harbinensis TaxID=1286938 RepID=A0ABW1C3Q3_9ACTN|nr:hypothetical protein [Nonomuraea harbinensis]